MTSPRIIWHDALVKRADRERHNGHGSGILWFTGLSGAGKSTLAHAVEQRLYALGVRTYVLDGDNVRHGLCEDLGFSEEDRTENIRRVGEVSKLFVDAGMLVLTAFISPFREDRDRVRNLVAPGDFFEIYCDCALAICEERDVKGLYMQARAGEVKQFTGISSPYEEPLVAELTVDTGALTLDYCVEQVLSLLQTKGILKSATD